MIATLVLRFHVPCAGARRPQGTWQSGYGVTSTDAPRQCGCLNCEGLT
jgi:hypothetical protein